MLNILIAVVSESYESALIRAQKLFLTARLELVTEFEALGIPNLLSQGAFMESPERYSALDDEAQARPPYNVLVAFFMPVGRYLQSLFRLYHTGLNDDDDDAEDDWQGRVLDSERRTRKLLQASDEHTQRSLLQTEERLLAMVKQSESATREHLAAHIEALTLTLERVQDRLSSKIDSQPR